MSNTKHWPRRMRKPAGWVSQREECSNLRIIRGSKMTERPPRRGRETLLDREFLLADAERARAQAREEFFAFREYIRPTAKRNWWTQELALEFQKFYEDFDAGLRPKLVLMAPPQHGKSTVAEDFIAYFAGKNPRLKIVYASYSEQLGITRNLNLQRIFRSERYQQVFGNTRVGAEGF